MDNVLSKNCWKVNTACDKYSKFPSIYTPGKMMGMILLTTHAQFDAHRSFPPSSGHVFPVVVQLGIFTQGKVQNVCILRAFRGHSLFPCEFYRENILQIPSVLFATYNLRVVGLCVFIFSWKILKDIINFFGFLKSLFPKHLNRVLIHFSN